MYTVGEGDTIMSAMNLLTEARVRNAKPEVRLARGARGKALDNPDDRPAPRLTKLLDGGGLALWVMPDGAKRWRFAYRFDGRQKSLSLGTYPETSLAEARAGLVAAKKLLRAGTDPSENKRVTKLARALANANTFAAIAAELLDKKRRENKSPATIKKFGFLRGLAAPLAERPIAEISAAEILSVLQKVESRGRYATAIRLRGFVSEIFCHGVATARCQGDPTTALRRALTTHKVKHRAAILEPAEFGALLRSIDDMRGGMPETKLALRLLPLVFTRPGELRAMEWSEIFDFDGDRATWIIPAEKTKTRREPHRVPLSRQAVEIIRELRTISRGSKFVFPNGRTITRCMSDSAMLSALRRMGYAKSEMCLHGFRASFSSLANESGQWHRDAIEKQQSHADADAVRAAYARGDFWEERVRMMQWWADKCDELRENVGLARVA
jgi:integrase